MCPAQLCMVMSLALREPSLKVTTITGELTRPRQTHRLEETGLSNTMLETPGHPPMHRRPWVGWGR